MNKLLALLIVFCSMNVKADSYSDAYAKSWEAFYIQSGWQHNVTNYTTHFEEQYLKEYIDDIPEVIKRNGGVLYFIGNAAIKQQVTLKWEF